MTIFLKIPANCFVIVIGLAAMAAAVRAEEKVEAKTENKLVGTWKVVSMKYGGQDVQRSGKYTQLKHVTPTHFMWATYDEDGKVAASLGGSYMLKGNEYVETPEYGVGTVLEQLKGKPQAFTWKIEGNQWYHNGKLSSGLTIEEVWERVER